jgi:sulfite reductase (ferredoxin)
MEKEQAFKSSYEILIKDIGENLCDWLMRKKQPCRIKPEIDTTDFDVAIPETLLEVPKVTIEDTVALKLENQMS